MKRVHRRKASPKRPMKQRSQFKTASGHYAKRNKKNGQIMNVKSNKKPFKRVRKEK